MNNDVFAELEQAQEAVDKLGQAPGHGSQPWTPELVTYLSTSILILTALALILGSLLMWKRNNSGQDILRLYGVVIIVGLSALLLVVGFSNEQLTPIVGLFGAIAGYLLGKETGQAREDK